MFRAGGSVTKEAVLSAINLDDLIEDSQYYMISNVTLTNYVDADGTDIFYQDTQQTSSCDENYNHYSAGVYLKNIPDVNPLKLCFYLASGGGQTCYGCIQRNGVDVGSEQSVGAGSSATKFQLVSDVLPTDVFRVRYRPAGNTSFCMTGGKVGVAGTLETVDMTVCTESA